MHLRSLTNQSLSCDITASIGEEVDGRVGNITNVSNTTQRLCLGVGRLGIRWEETVQALVILLASGCPMFLQSSEWGLTSVEPIGPGAIMFEVMPRGPYSMATVLDRASIPALATETCAWNGVPR